MDIEAAPPQLLLNVICEMRPLVAAKGYTQTSSPESTNLWMQ